MFFRCSRSSSVKPPKPIDVKKLIENRVFLGLSLGKSPAKCSWNVLQKKCNNLRHIKLRAGKSYWSLSRAFSLPSPMYSDSSWNRILMNILLELLVSSSFSFMISSTSQLIASVKSRCAKNLLTFRSLFASSLWVVAYVSLKICWKGSTYVLLI